MEIQTNICGICYHPIDDAGNCSNIRCENRKNCLDCRKCLSKVVDANGVPVTMTRLIVCPECGNKRCPKASDHNLKCTHSNMPWKTGSIYT